MVASYAAETESPSAMHLFHWSHASQNVQTCFHRRITNTEVHRPCASLIARLVLSSNHKISAAGFREDPTWYVVPMEDWAIVEICSGLIYASLLPLKPLIKIFVPWLFKLPKMNVDAVRPSRSGVSAYLFGSKEMKRLGLDPRTYVATFPSENTIEKGHGVPTTEAIFIINTYPDMLQKPGKVLIQ